MSGKKKVLVYECISGGGFASLEGEGLASPEGEGPDPDLLAQGVAMRDALAADLQRLGDVVVSCVASRHAPLPAALASVRCLDVGEGGQTAADFLAREIPAHDHVWVVAPECDDLLAQLSACVGAERWVGCSTPAIRVASSKSATRRCLAAAGIAVPAAWCPGDPDPAADAGWIVKPDDGAGSVGAYRYVDFDTARDDFLARLGGGVASTLEAWIDGIPLSLSLLCCDGRAELLAINRQHIVSPPGGAVVYQGVDIGVAPVGGSAGRRLAALAQQIAAALPGLAGYVGVDVVWPAASLSDNAAPVVIEINPRVTCAYVGLSAALGRNLAGEILAADVTEAAQHGLH
ncbi:MAG TPA: ATP-grasp domain-containing protein [Aromatoleum sp.]|uniref:ATP-grasp domain-containing protein n=1 Tax=Aromatoleum sp. TaxID=2307007 RepID=UPI002B48E30B|nr:ATP-grasp domain-containing protein [Aromatoleum sp.]HJV25845.1 ATP-grasp domain-containing protein [Aromatoleum sp.]